MGKAPCAPPWTAFPAWGRNGGRSCGRSLGPSRPFARRRWRPWRRWCQDPPRRRFGGIFTPRRGRHKKEARRLDKGEAGPYNKSRRDTAARRSALASQLRKLTAWGLSERSTRFYGQYVQRERQTHQKSKYSVQPIFPHSLHPPSPSAQSPLRRNTLPGIPSFAFLRLLPPQKPRLLRGSQEMANRLFCNDILLPPYPFGPGGFIIGDQEGFVKFV